MDYIDYFRIIQKNTKHTKHSRKEEEMMRKFKFLVPIAAAAAALSSEATANIAEPPATAGPQNSAMATSTVSKQAKKLFYVKDGELHTLMMQPSKSGQIFAWHSSHSSHSSHNSHQSHRSGG